MKECPFLSLGDKKVECFAECALYKYEENGGVCPFLDLKDTKFDILESYNNDDLETTYKEFNFLTDYCLDKDKGYF